MAVEQQQISDIDLARVRELKRIAVQCLTDINTVLQPYVDADLTTATSATVSLFAGGESHYDYDGGVPPVYQDPVHTVYGPNGCIYQTVDPPGISRPCPAQ